MDYTICTNWQNEIIDILAAANLSGEIKEIYGKLAIDDIGGGRPSSAVSYVSKQKAKKHIQKLKQQGFKFNYLLNTLCLDNLEFTKKGEKKLRSLLHWLTEIEIDIITVANPYILIWLKQNYPKISISISAMANISSLKTAKFWDDLGADTITFPGPLVNRNFPLIKQLKANISCRIQLIANNGCILNCPSYIQHALMNCHASQKWHISKGYMLDYHLINCRYQRFKDPTKFIRSDFIRPEDISFYEKLGVDSIKLVDRRLPSDIIAKIIKAYTSRSYSGNLCDLIHTFYGKTFDSHKNWRMKFFYWLSAITRMNITKILKFSKLLSTMNIYIDNKKLNEFLTNIPSNCDPINCNNCNYCTKWTEQSLQTRHIFLKSEAKKYKKILEEIYKNGLSFF